MGQKPRNSISQSEQKYDAGDNQAERNRVSKQEQQQETLDDGAVCVNEAVLGEKKETDAITGSEKKETDGQQGATITGGEKKETEQGATMTGGEKKETEQESDECANTNDKSIIAGGDLNPPEALIHAVNGDEIGAV